MNIGNQDGFELIDSQYKDLLHLRDAKYGGEMFLFKNGTFTTWGLERARSEGFIEQFLNENKLKYEANLEYTVDEDEYVNM